MARERDGRRSVDGKVVTLYAPEDEADEAVPLRTGERPDYCMASHRRVRLETEERRVYCRDCGREIPPFDYLLTLAREPERYMESRKDAQRRAVLAREQLKDLEREIRNAKARLRRARG